MTLTYVMSTMHLNGGKVTTKSFIGNQSENEQIENINVSENILPPDLGRVVVCHYHGYMYLYD